MRKHASVAVIIFTLLTVSVFGQVTEEEQVISVDSATVVMNAAITDASGSYVSGLKREQFTILENGIEQKIEFFAAGFYGKMCP